MKKVVYHNFSIIFIIVLFQPICVFSGGRLEVHFIDVGQGESILVKSPSNEAILIDTGNLSSAYKVKQYLNKIKVSELDALIVTHMHPDHVGGVFCVLPEFNVKTVYDNGMKLPENIFWEQYYNMIRNIGLKQGVLGAGRYLNYGAVQLDVLFPFEPLTMDLNTDSIVTRIRYGKTTFLLTADLTKAGEKRLLQINQHLESQVLKVGHHGACDATSDLFLDKVNPEIAVISVGQKNRWSYPCSETIQKLKKRRIRILRTDMDGNIVVQSNGEQITVTAETF